MNENTQDNNLLYEMLAKYNEEDKRLRELARAKEISTTDRIRLSPLWEPLFEDFVDTDDEDAGQIDKEADIFSQTVEHIVETWDDFAEEKPEYIEAIISENSFNELSEEEYNSIGDLFEKRLIKSYIAKMPEFSTPEEILEKGEKLSVPTQYGILTPKSIILHVPGVSELYHDWLLSENLDNSEEAQNKFLSHYSAFHFLGYNVMEEAYTELRDESADLEKMHNRDYVLGQEWIDGKIDAETRVRESSVHFLDYLKFCFRHTVLEERGSILAFLCSDKQRIIDWDKSDVKVPYKEELDRYVNVAYELSETQMDEIEAMCRLAAERRLD